MKKLLFLLLGLAVAVGANAGVNKQVSTAQTKSAITFKTQRVAQPVPAQPAFYAPVTEQPAGELKVYQRSGKALWRTSSGLSTGNQSGSINIVFGDNNKVYFEDLLYGFYGGYWTPPHAWIEGTLSEDGTKITVPLGQSVYYNSNWDADIILCWGTSAVSGSSVGFTCDEAVTEAVYAVEGNKISLLNSQPTPDAAYAAYEGTGLSCWWSDDQTWGYAIEWNTVFEILDEATLPENVMVTPDVNTASVSWDDLDDTAWNVRYRLYDPDNMLWDFEDAQADDNALPGGWTSIDADGDGYMWYHLNTDGEWNCHSGSGHLTSASYQSTALTPDNWLVSPQTKLFGQLSLWINAQDPEWPDEVFAVYVSTGDPTDPTSFVLISDEEVVATGEPTEYTFDLSQFDGQMGYVAVRHFNCTDNFRLNVDDVAVGYPWIYANGVENNSYVMGDLEAGTTYEVQVQAVSDINSDWTESVEFTTLTPAVTPDVYMLGGNMDNWVPNDGVKFNYDEETALYTLNFTFDGRHDGYNYFGFTKELAENNDDGGWSYIAPFRFGAVSEGDFEVNDGTLNIDISLIPFNDGGQAFKIPAGEYNMTLNLENMTLKIEKVEVPPVGLKGDVNDDQVVNITDVTILITAIMSENFDIINFYNSDMNDDNGISITDVTMLINYVMSLQ